MVREVEPHGDGLAEQVFGLDRLAGRLADEVELVFEQGAQALFTAHGAQQQDIFAEGGGGDSEAPGALAEGYSLVLGGGGCRGADGSGNRLRYLSW